MLWGREVRQATFCKLNFIEKIRNGSRWRRRARASSRPPHIAASPLLHRHPHHPASHLFYGWAYIYLVPMAELAPLSKHECACGTQILLKWGCLAALFYPESRWGNIWLWKCKLRGGNAQFKQVREAKRLFEACIWLEGKIAQETTLCLYPSPLPAPSLYPPSAERTEPLCLGQESAFLNIYKSCASSQETSQRSHVTFHDLKPWS